MPRFRRSHGILPMMALTVGLLASDNAIGAAAPKSGGTARFALSRDITALNPFVLTQPVDRSQLSKLDQLLEEGRRVRGCFEKRHTIYREVVLLLQDQVPEIFVMLNPYVFGLRPNLKGFQPSSDGRFSFGVGGLPFAWLEP